LSDVAESIVDVAAAALASFSLRLSSRPPDNRFPYGYGRIAFFSAGLESTMMIGAGLAVIVAAVEKWIAGVPLQNLGVGILFTLATAVVNAALGWYLIRTSRRTNSLILEANGKHVLTDSWTSFGVVGGLGLVVLTGWKAFDPLMAIGFALNILWWGGQLTWRCLSGLLDYCGPKVRHQVYDSVARICSEFGLQYHTVRFRPAGRSLLIDLHLVFPEDTAIKDAHRVATRLEHRLPEELGMPAEVTTHLESIEDHDEIHDDQHWTQSIALGLPVVSEEVPARARPRASTFNPSFGSGASAALAPVKSNEEERTQR
jgi:cation diffusion facilitator family transporter